MTTRRDKSKMADESIQDNDILDTPFYTYHKGDVVWLGVLTPFGVLAQAIPETEWIDWLRQELVRSHETKVSEHIRMSINGK